MQLHVKHDLHEAAWASVEELVRVAAMPPVKRPPRERARTFLREWREYRGLKQNQVADQLEIEPSTLSRLEAGKTPYDQDILERLALIYGCDPGDLLQIDPSAQSPRSEVLDRLRDAPANVRDRALAVLDALLKTG